MRFWRNTSIASQAPGQTATLSDGTLGYEWDEDARQRLPSGGAGPPSSTTSERRPGPPGLRLHVRRRHRDPPPDALPGAERGAGLRRRHDPVVLGPRRQSRPRQLDPRPAHAAGDGQPARRHGRPARHAAGAAWSPATASTDTHAADLDDHRARRRRQRRERRADHDQRHRRRDAGGGQVGGVEVSTDGGTTWHPAPGTRQLDLHLDARRDRQRHDQDPRGRRQRQPRDARRGRHRQRHRRAPARARSGTTRFTARRRTTTRTRSSSASSSAPTSGRLHHRHPLLQGRRQHRHPRRPPVDGDGTQLAAATFSGETASGWQQVSFDSPVAIDANTTYVASYHAPNGHYAATNGYFATGGSTTRRCTRSATASTGRTASTTTGRPAGSSRPTPSSRATTGSTSSSRTPSGRTPPRRRSPRARPADGATGVSTGANVTATFSEPMDPATINGDQRRAAGPVERARPSHGHLQRRDQRRATLDPNSRPAELDHLHGDGEGRARRRHRRREPGNALAADSTWSFTTAAPPPPPPDEGPGGPILVISQRRQPVQPLLRRDPARRGTERVHRDRHLQRHAGDPERATTSRSSATDR